MKELDRQTRGEAVASLQRYFAENMPEPLGDLPAGMLLDFFLAEVGPLVYNAAIGEAQTRMLRHMGDFTGDLYEKPFSYWPAQDAKRRSRR